MRLWFAAVLLVGLWLYEAHETARTSSALTTSAGRSS